ncbi:MAG: ABC transporter ATP-binding protein [Geminicoccaceae bacterium]|nr:ABC transporter ATP-binding protein [Geminicoccaceae bacterium]
MSYLVLDGVAKRFGKDEVLKDASLSIEKNEMVAIFGPSGVGKTVLLRLISGVAPPDAGDIRVGGESVLGTSPEVRETGVAFQNFALYPHMNAFENIASPLRARGADEAEVKRKVQETGELLKIAHVLHHLPRQLSNGQKQRTALGRALVRRPKIILLDDPLRNVDAKLRYEMRLELPRLLKRFESTVLYVTQDYKEAMALGERVAVLFDGRFQQVDHPAAVYRSPRHVEIARLFGDPTINLYPIRPTKGEGGHEVTVLGQTLRLKGRAGLDRPCLIGIRPEDVHVEQEPSEGSFPVELDAVTPLNVRTVLFLRTKEREEVFATCSESRGERFGRDHRQVHARVDFEKALLFDEATGERLAA